MNVFERYLTVWVGLCIIAGVVLGQFLPDVFHAIASVEIARVNIPVMLLVVRVANATQGWYGQMAHE